jgi:VCBS repeat-containing protein
VTTERYYGPTTLGAIQEFLRLGEISGQTFIINSCDGTRKQISEIPGSC